MAETDVLADHTDVIVIGAGLAGLTAASDLNQLGYSVRVLEASAAVGGRVQGAPIGDGQTIELGGQWLGPTQDHILELVERLGLQTYCTPISGQHTYFRRGGVSRYDSANGPIPPMAGDAVMEITEVIERLQRLSAEVSAGTPWTSPRAQDWDAQSFRDWVDSNATTADARMLIDYVTRNTSTCEPDQLSVLHMLNYVAAAGNAATPGSLLRVVVTADGASMWRIRGGSQQIPQLLAASLADAVTLSAPVIAIEQDEDSVAVTTEEDSHDGGRMRRYTAARVVVAIPPAASARIAFSPKLPSERISLAKGLLNGAQIKINVVYDQPFWRERGLSGYVLSDTGPAQNVWDNTPEGGKPGVLVCFIKGEAARALDTVDDDAVSRQLIDNLQVYFGTAAASPRQILIKRWHTQPWIWGCPGSLAPPGLLTGFGHALRHPVDRIHWAGTETAYFWQGFMDGAVSSGHRAAEEVAAVLTRKAVHY